MRENKNATVDSGKDMRVHKLKWLSVHNKSKNIVVLGNVSQVSIAKGPVIIYHRGEGGRRIWG